MPALEDIERFSPAPSEKGTVPEKGDSPLFLTELLKRMKKYLRLYHATWQPERAAIQPPKGEQSRATGEGRPDGSPEGKILEPGADGVASEKEKLLEHYGADADRRIGFVKDIAPNVGPEFEGEARLIRIDKLLPDIQNTGLNLKLLALTEHTSPIKSFKWRQYVNFFLDHRQEIEAGKRTVYMYSSGNAIQGALRTVHILKTRGLRLRNGAVWKLPPDFKVIMVAYDFLDEKKRGEIVKFNDLGGMVFINDFIQLAKEKGIFNPQEDETV